MKKQHILIREQQILDTFAKNFNKIKRLEEQEVDELNIAKGVAALGLAASLAGNPMQAKAQTQKPQTTQVSQSSDTAQLATKPNIEAAVIMLRSYRENPFSAIDWAKQNKKNAKLYGEIKRLSQYQTQNGQIEPEDMEKLGATYKTTPIATAFIKRDSL